MDDLAKLAVEQGQQTNNVIIDAIGPETFTYRELVQQISEIIGKQRPIISVSPTIGYWTGWIIGRLMGDVMVTREEIEGLMADLLYTTSPPAGETKLTDWARAHANDLGRYYASELARRRDREQPYEKL